MSTSVKEILQKTGALMEGHFLLSSGFHSPVYWEKFRVLAHPGYVERLCRLLAQHFHSLGVEVVAGPTLGGMILAYEVARQLEVRAIYAEREGEERIFRRGQSLSSGERVLVVDDVLTTGGSIQEVVTAVTKQGGNVAGIGVVVDRSQGKLDFGIPLFSCYRMSAPAFKPAECPQCRSGLPLTRLGGSR